MIDIKLGMESMLRGIFEVLLKIENKHKIVATGEHFTKLQAIFCSYFTC